MKYIYILLFSFFFFTGLNAQIKYVTEYGDGTMDGSSWANAWSGQIFADTIYSVTSGTQVWVAKGTYRPSKDTNGLFPTDPFNSVYEIQKQCTFKIQSGVKLIGGFEGYESSVEQRVESLMFGPNTVNVTNLNGENEFTQNARSNHIITLQNVNNSTIVDGFCFYYGEPNEIYINSNGSQTSNPIIRKCCFFQGFEGILIDAQGATLSTPIISNCIFAGLSSQYNVGGVRIKGNAKVSISNSIFYSNQGELCSCIGFEGSHGGSINNCTFYENFTDAPNGIGYRADIGISSVDDSVYVNNCIVRHGWWQAGRMTNTRVVSGNNYFSVKNCNFQAQDTDPAYYSEPATKINCIDEDPQFFNISDLWGNDQAYGTADDGYNLIATSPCIDAGFNDLIPTYMNKDITGSKRVSNCRVDIGAYEFQTPPATNISLPENTLQSCTQYPVGDTGTIYMDPASCLTSAKLNPSGANPLSGTIKVCVKKDVAVQVVNGVPYVQRHYEIEPLENPSTATSRVTLYFTQQEFDDYNTAATTFPQLPTSPTDVTGIANVKIEQDHGTSLTSVPGSYNGATVYIDPADADILWNSTSSIWEVSFNVTGFSGFFMTTFLAPLPITLSSFSAMENNGAVKLNWQTASEINSKYFDVERSADGSHFVSIGKVNAAGNSNGQLYTFYDKEPIPGLNYYKLGMTDINGSKKYSAIVIVKLKSTTGKIEIVISPNPATINTTITVMGQLKGKGSFTIYDINGRKVASLFTGEITAASFTTVADLSKLQKGIYIVEIQIGGERTRSKLIIQ